MKCGAHEYQHVSEFWKAFFARKKLSINKLCSMWDQLVKQLLDYSDSSYSLNVLSIWYMIF